MMPEKRRLRSAAALLLLLFALLVMGLFAVLPHVAVRWTNDNIARDLAQLERLLAMARTVKGMDARDAQIRSSIRQRKFLLSGDTTGIAAAELQRLLLKRLARHNGYAFTVQVQPPEAEGQLLRIPMSMVTQINLKGLRDLLVDLESATPVLFVEEMTIRSMKVEAGRKPSRKLNVTFRIAGYQTKEPKPSAPRP